MLIGVHCSQGSSDHEDVLSEVRVGVPGTNEIVRNIRKATACCEDERSRPDI